jgi:hypothetical protein
MDHTRKAYITEAQTRTPFPRAFNAAREALTRAGFEIDCQDVDGQGLEAGGEVKGVRRVRAPGIVLPYRCSIDVEAAPGGGAAISTLIIIEYEWSLAALLILVAIFSPVLPLAFAPSALTSAIAIAGILAVAAWAIWLNFAGGNAYAKLDAEVWEAIQRQAPVTEGTLTRRTVRI